MTGALAVSDIATGSSTTPFTLKTSLANIALTGGAGADTLIGAGGGDILTGGAGADKFIFAALSASPVTNKAKITDFDWAKGDVIDLSGIIAPAQANKVTAFSNHANELMLTYDAGQNTTSLLIDKNGDGAADFNLVVNGHQTFDHGWIL